MAKMWPVSGLDPSGDFASSARRVIAVRSGEFYSHLDVLAEPENAVGLHDLRISIKRLRYSLEFFAVCFEQDELAWMLTSLSELQELLGNLHDADEVIPHLHRVLGEVEEQRALAPDATVGEQAPGIVFAIRSMRAQREAGFTGANRLWSEMEEQGFRARLERFVEGATSPQEVQ
jgi:CHAD domain-containing protein